MPIIYIGRTTSFRGKSLWDIVGNLKNFGVGRMVVRSKWERYPELSYLRIVKVEAQENEPIRKVRVLAEKVFRGKKMPGLNAILKTSYKNDYRLIPKDEEDTYIRGRSHDGKPITLEERVVPLEMPLPPLLLELNKSVQHGKDAKVVTTIPLVIRQGPANRAVARPDVPLEATVFAEEPDVPRLYQGLK